MRIGAAIIIALALTGCRTCEEGYTQYDYNQGAFKVCRGGKLV